MNLPHQLLRAHNVFQLANISLHIICSAPVKDHLLKTLTIDAVCLAMQVTPNSFISKKSILWMFSKLRIENKEVGSKPWFISLEHPDFWDPQSLGTCFLDNETVPNVITLPPKKGYWLVHMRAFAWHFGKCPFLVFWSRFDPNYWRGWKTKWSTHAFCPVLATFAPSIFFHVCKIIKSRRTDWETGLSGGLQFLREHSWFTASGWRAHSLKREKMLFLPKNLFFVQFCQFPRS